MTEDTQTRQTPAVKPEEYGVGARFSVHPMSDDFVSIILNALESTEANGLDVHTDDVSTYVTGEESSILRYLTDVIASVGHSGVHTVAHVLFSRGCPGEVTCELSGDEMLAPAELSIPGTTGLRASAHWSLYPLADSGETSHMAVIERAVQVAKESGTFARPEHYATRLEGDLADVLTTMCSGWLRAGREVQHVASHGTVSLHSPSWR
jgi:uncharacterized protein YqgV (UPF0045/DUF77 family)